MSQRCNCVNVCLWKQCLDWCIVTCYSGYVTYGGYFVNKLQAASEIWKLADYFRLFGSQSTPIRDPPKTELSKVLFELEESVENFGFAF